MFSLVSRKFLAMRKIALYSVAYCLKNIWKLIKQNKLNVELFDKKPLENQWRTRKTQLFCFNFWLRKMGCINKTNEEIQKMANVP